MRLRLGLRSPSPARAVRALYSICRGSHSRARIRWSSFSTGFKQGQKGRWSRGHSSGVGLQGDASATPLRPVAERRSRSPLGKETALRPSWLRTRGNKILLPGQIDLPVLDHAPYLPPAPPTASVGPACDCGAGGVGGGVGEACPTASEVARYTPAVAHVFLLMCWRLRTSPG